jgi:hypothetical protein
MGETGTLLTNWSQLTTRLAIANSLKEKLLDGKSPRRIFLARPRLHARLRPDPAMRIAIVTRLVYAIKTAVDSGQRNPLDSPDRKNRQHTALGRCNHITLWTSQ